MFRIGLLVFKINTGIICKVIVAKRECNLFDLDIIRFGYGLAHDK